MSSSPSQFQFESLGQFTSCFSDRFGTPRQPHLVPHARASLKLRADLSPTAIVQGLEQFSHVWLLWVFHQNTNKVVRPKIHPPRLAGESIGVFASRTPHRPNPIGLSLVKLDRVVGDTLFFSEVDLISGTPILDIKPYVKECDFRKESRDGWASEVTWTNFTVQFAPQATQFLVDHERQLPVPQLEIQSLIQEVLSQDPRPLVYKGDTADPSPYREDYFIYLYNLNVRFRYPVQAGDGKIQNENPIANVIRVEEIEFITSKRPSSRPTE